MDKLEKIRRKWYKKNLVSDFDVDYQPPAQGYPSANPASGNARANNAS